MGSFGGFLGEERLLADDQGIVLFKPEEVATDVASKNLGNLVSRVAPAGNGRKNGKVDTVFLVELLDKDGAPLFNERRIFADDQVEHLFAGKGLAVDQ